MAGLQGWGRETKMQPWARGEPPKGSDLGDWLAGCLAEDRGWARRQLQGFQ